MYVKNDNVNWNKPLTFICKQKINFILHVLPEILQRYSNFVILGALGMPGYGHAKLFWYYQLVENVRVCFGRDSPRTTKMIISFCRKLRCLFACQKQFDHSLLKWNYHLVKNVVLTCRQKLDFIPYQDKISKFLILGTLGMPGYPHPKW